MSSNRSGRKKILFSNILLKNQVQFNTLQQDAEEDSAPQQLLSSTLLSKKRKVVPDFSSGSLSSFVVRTIKSNKEEIDKQIYKQELELFMRQTAVSCVLNNLEVKKAITLLRPGYVPPSRHDVSNKLVDEVYNEEKSKCFKDLSGSSVCLSLDGWSNIHNEPIICATVTTENGSSFLVDTMDTSGNPHTSVYLTALATNIIKTLKTDYTCTVSSFVTDNAANMNAMRNQIKESTEPHVITYGCDPHILDLLCKDLEISENKKHVTFVVKYFKKIS